MNLLASLNVSHLRTYQTIFQHPISHNLNWRDVHALLHTFATVTEEPNGNRRATLNGQTLVLHPTLSKDVAGADEVMALRHFLERAQADAPVADAAPAFDVHGQAPDPTPHRLLVIDHREARIFGTVMKGGLPESLRPHEPADHFRHAHNSADFSRGKEKPEPNSFFEPVAQALQGAGPILVFGTGTGMSSEMDQFVAWVKTHHPEIAKRIVDSVVVDPHHLTDAQLLATARECYAKHRETRP